LQGLVRPCLNPRGYFLRKGIDASGNIGWAVLMVSGLHLHQHDGLAWFWPAADSHRYAPTLISIAGVGNMSLSVTSARGERPARRNVRIARNTPGTADRPKFPMNAMVMMRSVRVVRSL